MYAMMISMRLPFIAMATLYLTQFTEQTPLLDLGHEELNEFVIDGEYYNNVNFLLISWEDGMAFGQEFVTIDAPDWVKLITKFGI